MIFSLKNFLKGYLLVDLTGRDVERYLNLCGKNDILVWNIRRRDDKITCSMDISGYKKSRPFLKKTKTRGRIRKKTGLPFYTFRYRKRWFFAAGCLLALLVLYLSSGFVWRIELRGNSYVSDERILQLLENNDWFYGNRIASLDTEELEKTLRNELPDIIWVSADLTGTCLTLELKENLRLEEKDEPASESSEAGTDLIAAVDGTVVSIVTRQGTPMVAAGDEVKAGDVLISGIVELTDPMTQEMKKTYCEAEGDVIVASTMTYEESFPMVYEDKVFTGREFTFTLIGPHQAWIWKMDFIKPFERYDTLMERSQLTAGNGYFLPADKVRIVKKEYEILTLERTREEAKEKIKEDFSFYLQNLQEKGIQTLEKNVMISYKDGQCLAKGTLKVQQAMTEKRPVVEEIAVEEENNGHELQ